MYLLPYGYQPDVPAGNYPPSPLEFGLYDVLLHGRCLGFWGESRYNCQPSLWWYNAGNTNLTSGLNGWGRSNIH